MKRALVAVLAIALSALLTACSSSGASPTATPAPALEDEYLIHNIKVPYETIPPVKPGDAKEIKITLPTEMEHPQVIAMRGGGALALGQKVEYGALKKVKSSKIIAARYDADGKTLWTKVYEELPGGYIGNLQPTGDHSFVFTCLAPGENNDSSQFIVFCNGDGHIAYQESSRQTMKYQYILPDAGNIVVGDAQYKDGKPVEDSNLGAGEEMLSIQAQGLKSSVFFSRVLGVEGYFSPMGAVWSMETGLVVLAPKRQPNSGNQYEILAFDIEMYSAGDPKQKWTFRRMTEGNQYIGGILSIKGGVLVNGFDNNIPFILKLDINGKTIWEIEPDSNGDYSVIAMAAFPDGGFTTALNRYKEGDSMRGVYLALYDENGHETKRTKLSNEMIREIKPTDDGGLITVGTQNKKVLPAPAFVSSIWFDTETIVTSYDKDLNIRWRKVYDKYVDETTQDIAVPAADGSVIVEK